MIFHPQNLIKTGGQYVFPAKANATAHPALNKAVIREFFHNFTFGCSETEMLECGEYIFRLGNTDPIPLGESEYTIRIAESGICLLADGEQNLLKGFMTLLDRILAIETESGMAASIECYEIRDRARIRNRMVHFCVFPETELWELQRLLRLAAALKYTHAVVEFWGMLKLACMKELSWPFAYEKEDAKKILAEAKDLGLEIIPMFNHWGHAAAAREMHGKHVVLDQNPALQTYFSEDGWCWDFGKAKVRALHKEIRRELIEVCGEGKYFHIGCDEPRGFAFTKEEIDLACDYIGEIAKDMEAAGRRVILWADTLLWNDPKYDKTEGFYCAAPTKEKALYMQAHMPKSVIAADWQYGFAKAPVPTAKDLTDAGFDCLLCPWEKGEAHAEATAKSVLESGLFGFLQTTWHTLSRRMPILTMMAKGAYEPIGTEENSSFTSYNTVTAALLRKVMPSHGEYRKCGWSPAEIDFLW